MLNYRNPMIERWNDLFKATQLWNARGRIWSKADWPPSLHSYMLTIITSWKTNRKWREITLTEQRYVPERALSALVAESPLLPFQQHLTPPFILCFEKRFFPKFLWFHMLFQFPHLSSILSFSLACSFLPIQLLNVWVFWVSLSLLFFMAELTN